MSHLVNLFKPLTDAIILLKRRPVMTYARRYDQFIALLVSTFELR